MDKNEFEVLGTYEGECADANITNLNGLDITRSVWETVFNSDEYRHALELGWYIGFLGHPDDPNCMDFEHACIVMTEGHIDDSGKVYGKFNLINTPVGRIVKAFQDAGVRFGISVRGAGDITNNSVDPDTFVFRGFDLVTFPAYPESVPKFSEIAASSTPEARTKYRRICAAVEDNIDGLNTCEAVDAVKSYFARQSDMYAALEKHKSEIMQSESPEDLYKTIDLLQQKVQGLLDLYLDEVEKRENLEQQITSLNNDLVTSARKLQSFRRIASAQMNDANSQLQKVVASYRVSKKINKDLKDKLMRSDSAIDSYKQRIAASTSSKVELQNQLNNSDAKYRQIEADNLKYKQRISAAKKDIESKDEVIASLESKLSETVTRVKELETSASNRGANDQALQRKLEAAQTLLRDYQQAYVSLYGTALGTHLENLPITASTSVSEVQKLIEGSSSVASQSPIFDDPYESIPSNTVDDGDLVTL